MLKLFLMTQLYFDVGFRSSSSSSTSSSSSSSQSSSSSSSSVSSSSSSSSVSSSSSSSSVSSSSSSSESSSSSSTIDFIDFSTWTEVDPNNVRTINTTQVITDDIVREDSGYIYNDTGSLSIGNFTFNFKLSNAFSSGTGFQTFGINGIVLSSILGYAGDGNISPTCDDGIAILLTMNSFSSLTFRVMSIHNNSYTFTAPNTDLTLSQNTDYWVTLSRVGSNIDLSVYTNEARTNLAGNVNFTPANGNDLFRYLYVSAGTGTVNTTTRFLDFTIDQAWLI